MPNPDVFDPHSVDDMNREPERWHERTVWVSVGERLDGATKQQLKQLMNMGLGENNG